MPAIVVKMIATIATKKKFRWMPARFSAKPETPMWTPLPSLTAEKKPEPSQPIVYAPIAKNATYPRSSRPAKPTMMFSPSAITT